MDASDLTLLRSLIVMAWADGKVAEEETTVIDALIESFGASEEEAAELREFAREPKTLEDVRLDELDEGNRRRLLQLSVLVSFVDGKQDETEKALLEELARRLEIPQDERDALLQSAAMRAQGLLRTLKASASTA